MISRVRSLHIPIYREALLIIRLRQHLEVEGSKSQRLCSPARPRLRLLACACSPAPARLRLLASSPAHAHESAPSLALLGCACVLHVKFRLHVTFARRPPSCWRRGRWAYALHVTFVLHVTFALHDTFALRVTFVLHCTFAFHVLFALHVTLHITLAITFEIIFGMSSLRRTSLCSTPQAP